MAAVIVPPLVLLDPCGADHHQKKRDDFGVGLEIHIDFGIITVFLH